MLNVSHRCGLSMQILVHDQNFKCWVEGINDTSSESCDSGIC